ncbi:hypothetical protein OQA88_897 [Cercophora sp. LCS_1]
MVTWVWKPFAFGHQAPADPKNASWQETAARKRRTDMSKIPDKWRLSKDVLDHAKQLRSIADDFIDGLLGGDTRRLTGLDVPELMRMTVTGSLTAVELTTAFCKRAAYAHQLVRWLSRLRLAIADFSTEPWLTDPGVLPIPWREGGENAVREEDGLSFGFMDFDGVVMPHPPIRRALNIVKTALQAEGHDLVPWQGPSHEEALAIHADLTSADGNYDVFDNLKLSGEPLIPQLVPDFPDGKPMPPKSAIEVEQTVLRMLRYRAR